MEPLIIQWNANGLGQRAKLGELERLLNKYNPMCICTQHVGKANIQIKNYKLAMQSSTGNGELGTAIYVHSKATYDTLKVNSSSFQPSAIALNIPGAQKLNILNMYNQPSFHYNLNELKGLVKSISHPKLVLGDMNSHSPIWNARCKKADRGGMKIEELMQEDNLECLNEENETTFYSNIHSTKTSIDIAMCSTRVRENYEWHVLEDTYTSDHNPVVITVNTMSPPNEPNIRFLTNQADWVN